MEDAVRAAERAVARARLRRVREGMEDLPIGPEQIPDFRRLSESS